MLTLNQSLKLKIMIGKNNTKISGCLRDLNRVLNVENKENICDKNGKNPLVSLYSIKKLHLPSKDPSS